MGNWLIPLALFAVLKDGSAKLADYSKGGTNCDGWYTVDIDAPFKINGNIGKERFELNWKRDAIPEGKKIVKFQVKAILENEDTEEEDANAQVTTEDFIRKVGEQNTLKSVHGTYLRAWDAGPGHAADLVDMAPHAKEWEHWTFLNSDGDLVLRSIHDTGVVLSADYNGAVNLAEKASLMTMWTPFRNKEDGSWSFMSKFGRWLTAGRDGTVRTVSEHTASAHFWLEAWQEHTTPRLDISSTKAALAFEGKRMLKTSGGKYLRAWKAGHEKAANEVDLAPHAKDWEHWTVIILGKDADEIVLESFHTSPQTYLQANAAGIVSVERMLDNKSRWTRFKNSDGSWSLRSYYGAWLSVTSGELSTTYGREFRGHFWLESWC